MYKFKKVANNGTITYISKKAEGIVPKEVHEYMTCEKEKQHSRTRCDGEYGTSSYWKCVDECPYTQNGFNMIPIEITFQHNSENITNDDFDPLDCIPTQASPYPDVIASDLDLLTHLMKRLNELISDDSEICRMLSEEYFDREISIRPQLLQEEGHGVSPGTLG